MNRHAVMAALLFLGVAVLLERRWVAIIALAICVLEIIRQENERLR